MPSSTALYSQTEFFKLYRRCGPIYRIPTRGSSYHKYLCLNNYAISSSVGQVPLGHLLKIGFADASRDATKQGLQVSLDHLSLGNDLEELQRMIQRKARDHAEDDSMMGHLNDLSLEVFGVRLHHVIEKSLEELDSMVKEMVEDAEESAENEKEKETQSELIDAVDNAAKCFAVGVGTALIRNVVGDLMEDDEAEEDKVSKACPSTPMKRKQPPKLNEVKNSKAARSLQYNELPNGGKKADKEVHRQGEKVDASNESIEKELKNIRQELQDLEGGFDEFTDTLNTSFNLLEEQINKRLDEMHEFVDARLPGSKIAVKE